MLVKVYISPTCPKCDKLLEALIDAGIRYGFEVLPEFVETEFEPFYTKDPASKIYSEEWIQKHGTKKQKELLKKAKPIVEVLGRSTVVPVIEITWNYGLSDRSLVIKGFRKELTDKAIRNLVETVLRIVGLERRISVPIGGRR